MTEPAHEIRVGDLFVALGERRVVVRETEVALTAHEFDILAAMASRPGWVFSALQLSDAEAPDGTASPDAVNVHISHLRAKLAEAGAPGYIATVRGVGWRLSSSDTDADIVQREVARLPERTQRLLRVASVVDGEFDPNLVAVAAGECEVAAGFDPAIEARVLMTGKGRLLSFRREFVREGLLTGLPTAEKEAMHRALAEAVRRTCANRAARTHRLAYHYARAGPAMSCMAVGYSIAAARAASTTFAYEDAIGHLETASGMIASAGFEPLGELRIRSVVRERLGGASSALSDLPRAIAEYESALVDRPAQDAFARARLFTKLARVCAQASRSGECVTAFARALRCLESIPKRGPKWWESWIEARLGQAEECLATDTPLPFGLHGELEVPVLAYGTALQRAKYYQGYAGELSAAARWNPPDEAVQAALRALDEATRGGSEHLQARMAGNLGGVYILREEPALAEPHLRRSLSLGRLCADSVSEARALLHLATCARFACDIRMTEAHACALADVLSDRTQLREFLSGVDAHLGWVALRRGQIERAAECCDRALGLWLDEPACSRSVWMMAWPAVSAAIRLGDPASALEYAMFMTRAHQQALGGGLDAGLRNVAELHRRDDREAASELLMRLEITARERCYS